MYFRLCWIYLRSIRRVHKLMMTWFTGNASRQLNVSIVNYFISFHIYIYIYIYIYICVCVCAFSPCACVCVCVWLCVWILVYRYVYLCIFGCICIYLVKQYSRCTIYSITLLIYQGIFFKTILILRSFSLSISGTYFLF